MRKLAASRLGICEELGFHAGGMRFEELLNGVSYIVGSIVQKSIYKAECDGW